MSNFCTPPLCIDENTPVIEPKTQWNADTDEQISSYKSELDSLLSAFSLPPDIAKCESDFCYHQNVISKFHDNLISSTTEAMHANISKCSDAKTRKVIPGWDQEMENARNNSLLWHYIWKQSNRPVSGHIYSIMKKCLSHIIIYYAH